MYLDHRTVDGQSNIIVDCYITPGNVHDSGPYLGRLDHVTDRYGFSIQRVALDSGYDTLDIKQGLKKNQNYTWLICAAQNMKLMALKLSRRADPTLQMA